MSSLEDLTKQLSVHQKNEDDEKIIEITKSVLKKYPNDSGAHQSLVRSLINTDKYVEALKEIESAKASSTLLIEHCYVLYKLEKLEDLQKLINETHSESNRGAQHCLAQAYYKAGLFDKARKVYTSLEKSFQNGVVNERSDLTVNTAAINALALDNNETSDNIRESSPSYDLLFNVATQKLLHGDYAKAVSLLSEAQLKCKTSTAESEAELQAELCPILIQLAYAQYLSGDAKSAHETLESLVQNGSAQDDLFLQLAIEINKKAFGKDDDAMDVDDKDGVKAENPFTLASIINTVVSKPGITKRLVDRQIKDLKFNELLLYNTAGRNVKKQTKKLARDYADYSLLSYIEGAEDNKLKHLQGDEKIAALFAKAQKFATEGKIDASTRLFSEFVADNTAQFPPAVRGVLAALYQVQGKMSKARNALRNESSSTKRELTEGEAIMMVQTEDNFGRSQDLESYFKSTNNKAGLAALTGDGSLKAELSPIDSLLNGIDVDVLKSQGVNGLLKKSANVQDGHIAKPSNDKQKRKRKQVNSSTVADPERWLPKRDRSDYKPSKKDLKNKTQGGVTDNTTETSTVSASPASSVVKSSKKSSKKKKGGR